MIIDAAIRFYAETDTMAIEVHPLRKGQDGGPDEFGGQDAGEDLVIHYAADGQPCLC